MKFNKTLIVIALAMVTLTGCENTDKVHTYEHHESDDSDSTPIAKSTPINEVFTSILINLADKAVQHQKEIINDKN